MEAARLIPLSRRDASLERELDRLRPFGEAYLMRNFGEQLAHADAEDAVSDVTLRLHRQIAAGHPPENLQAAFLTGCRNAAIDRLRLRARKPTVEIEAAADAASELPAPAERAERRELSARMREVLLRVNPRQRRVLTLRFGAGQTVPEIAAEMGISLAAAKNLLARAIAQARRHLEAIEGRQLCAQMQGELREALDRELAGTESDALLRAHLEHCGACKSFLASIRRDLHAIGAPAGLVATGAGPLHHLGRFGEQALALAHGAGEKVRLAAYRLTGLGGDGGPGAGVLAGGGQKIAALCGAAASATCLATGLVGPGVGVLDQHHDQRPPVHKATSQVRSLSELPSAETEAPPESQQPTASPPSGTDTSHESPQPTAPAPEPEPTRSEEGAEQFGFESSAPPPEPQPEPAPQPAPAPSAPTAPAQSSGGGGGGGESFGFSG